MEMESSDEDDKFLYGSDDGSNIETGDDKDQNELHNTSNGDNKRKLDDLDDVLDETRIESTNKKIKVSNKDDEANQDKEEGKSNSSSDVTTTSNSISREEDEDDIIFIISLGPDTSRLDFRSIVNLTSNATIPISTTTSNYTGGDTISVAVETSTLKDEKEALDNEKLIQNEELKSNINNTGSIDLDQDGLYDGQPITQLDPEVLKEKPWRQPGANLSDYFNYGFNELTWVEYVHRQGKLRDEYNPRKILMGLMNLQQQGKLDIKTTMPTNDLLPQLNNKTNMLKQPLMQQSMMQPPPPGFPPIPMFGGFPPFPMPGMMPMNQLQPNTSSGNSNSNSIQANNINNTKK